MTPALRELASALPSLLLSMLILAGAYGAVRMTEGYADYSWQQDHEIGDNHAER